MNNSSDSKETKDHTVAHTRYAMNVYQMNEQMRWGEPAGGPGSCAEEGPLPRDRPTSQGWGEEQKPGPQPEALAFPGAPLSLSRSFNLMYGRELAVNPRMLQGGTTAEPAGRGGDHWMNRGPPAQKLLSRGKPKCELAGIPARWPQVQGHKVL